MKFKPDTNREAIIAEAGHAVVTGGPGSGKTTVALMKAKERITTLSDGQNILFLSFSRAAVQQIRDRMHDVLRRSERHRIDVSTYHLFCLRIIESHGDLLGGRRPQILYPGEERLRKARDPDTWGAERDRLAEEESVYTFDMFASIAATLVERCESVRRLLGDRYPLIILDEFQDTNDDQWRLVRALGSASTTVALADPDQRIYGYQGNIDPARVEIYEKEFDARRFDLGTDNHRSPSSDILQYGDALLHNRPLPKAKSVNVVATSPMGDGWALLGHAAVLWQFSELKKMGVEHPSIALLARTNDCIGKLSDTIQRENEFDGRALRPIHHEIVWDAELATAAGQVVASVMEWPGRPWREGAASTLRFVEAYYRMKYAENPSKSAAGMADDFQAAAVAVLTGRRISKKSPRELAAAAEQQLIMSGSPVTDWLLARSVVGSVSNLTEVAGASRMLRLFRATDVLATGLNDLWLRQESYAGAAAWLRRTLDREKLVESQRSAGGLILMNMHKSKGKEFDGVVIVEQPHRWLISDLESRRLLRMAVTRARHRVVIARTRGAPPLTS